MKSRDTQTKAGVLVSTEAKKVSHSLEGSMAGVGCSGSLKLIDMRVEEFLCFLLKGRIQIKIKEI